MSYRSGINSPIEQNVPEGTAGKRSSIQRRLLRIGLGVVIGFGMLFGGTLVLIYSVGEHEARYEGKTAYQWLTQMKSPDPALSNAANVVLNRRIIPELTRVMVQDTNDSRMRIALVEYLNTLPGVNILYPVADTRRADAADLLGEFGPCAKAAAPALLQALQGQDAAVRPSAAGALGKIQADPAIVIPLLIKCLDQKDVDDSAALALADYGAAAKAAVPKLIELSKVRDKDLHHAVVVALSKIDPAAAAQAGVR